MTDHSDSLFEFVASEDPRETYIPLRHDDLIQLLLQQAKPTSKQSEYFEEIFGRLHRIFHAEHLAAGLAIDSLYSPLDPDCELTKVTSLEERQISEQAGIVVRQIERLLSSAHYQRIAHEDLLKAIQMSIRWGVKLDVDFRVFDHLVVYVRGYRKVDVERRVWYRFFRKETVQIPEFRRLFLAFRIKHPVKAQQDVASDSVYLKLFKDIPETELEGLLPGTRVKLSPFDRGRVLFPTLSGAAPTLYKLYRGILVIGLAATLANVWGLVIVGGALASYIIKSMWTYFRTRERYQFELSHNLYIKNLDNNAGVLYRILNEAREQELCETLLGFVLLWKLGGEQGLTREQLDRECENFINAHTGSDVNFEVQDAVLKLNRLGIAEQSRDRWTAVELSVACQNLKEYSEQVIQVRMRSDKDAQRDLDENLFMSE